MNRIERSHIEHDAIVDNRSFIHMTVVGRSAEIYESRIALSVVLDHAAIVDASVDRSVIGSRVTIRGGVVRDAHVPSGTLLDNPQVLGSDDIVMVGIDGTNTELVGYRVSRKRSKLTIVGSTLTADLATNRAGDHSGTVEVLANYRPTPEQGTLWPVSPPYAAIRTAINYVLTRFRQENEEAT